MLFYHTRNGEVGLESRWLFFTFKMMSSFQKTKILFFILLDLKKVCAYESGK